MVRHLLDRAPTEITHRRGRLQKQTTAVKTAPQCQRESAVVGPSVLSSSSSSSSNPSASPPPASASLQTRPASARAGSAQEAGPSTFEDGTAGDSSGDEDEDPDADDATAFVSRAEGHPDPRELLRAQLARASTSDSVKRGRRDSVDGTSPGGAPKEQFTSTEVGDEEPLVSEEEARLYLPRRYFILSAAGKLVYTSDPSEEAATGLVGVMQAIVSIFADEGDRIRYIDAGQTRISFLLKAPLYLVVVSSQGEPEQVLRQHLDYLYLQVLSVVTLAQLQGIFAKRSNFDLRQLIGGTEPFFDSLVSSLQTSFAILLSSISVYRLAPSIRTDLARALDPGKDAIRELDLLYVLLLARGRLVTLLRPKQHSIHPTDLHLLLSTIYAPRRRAGGGGGGGAPGAEAGEGVVERPSPLLEPGAESWLPICLPRFNPRGFLHAYVSFFDSPTGAPAGGDGDGGEGGVGLVLLSSRRDAFPGVQSAAHAIKARLLSASPSTSASSGSGSAAPTSHSAATAAPGAAAADGGLVHSILKTRAEQAYSLGEVAVPGLRHFVYKDRERVQSTAPGWEGEYGEERGDEGRRARQRLMTLYQRLHQALHARPATGGDGRGGGKGPVASASVQYLRTSREAVLGWVTSEFELYVSTSPLLPHGAVVSAARSVSRWVQADEHRLFLSGKGAGVF
ncbi:Vacuolar fusion protein mon1 [Rhodotorula sphaerocarpa]